MQRRITRFALLALPLAAAFSGCESERSPIAPSRSDVGTVDDGTSDETARAGHGFHAFRAVYTMSNDATSNEVIAFSRGHDGALTPAATFSTGGAGTGAGLGSQGALRVAKVRGHRYVIACNAGSDEISLLEVHRNGLDLVDTAPSGGDQPISVTVHGDIVYVLNAGGDGNITGFRVRHGRLRPLDDSTRPLSGTGVGPAQIEFAPRGNLLVVTEKATNQIVTYRVDHRGRAGDPIVNASSGETPFGFAFDRFGRHIVVSEAFGGSPGSSAASSYRVNSDGSLTVVTASLASAQTAACWIGFARKDRYAYATNTGSGTVTGYRARPISGELMMLDADGVTAETGAGSQPIDLASAGGNGRFLYVLNAGTQEIAGFRVRSDGSLSAIDSVGGLPMGVNGLIAW